MNRHSRAISELLSKAIPAEKEGIWQQWLKAETRSYDDFKRLIESDLVQDDFKKRAITLLLNPPCKLPFEGRQSPFYGPYVHMVDIDVSKLSNALQWFAGELIVLCVPAARGDERLRGAFLAYQEYILEFLKVLPPSSDLATRLFEAYAFLEPTPEKIWGCLLSPLLCADIPEKWKYLAEAAARQSLAQQLVWDGAELVSKTVLPGYIKGLIFLSEQDDATNVAMVVSRLEFVLGFPAAAIREKGFFKSPQTGHILELIADPRHRVLLHNFATHIFLENTGAQQYAIFNPHSERRAQAILAEFSSDKNLALELRRLLRNYQKRERRRHQAQDKKMLAEASILNQMK